MEIKPIETTNKDKDGTRTQLTARVLSDQWQQVAKDNPDAVILVNDVLMSCASFAYHSKGEVRITFIPLAPHQERVVAEKAELEIKREKLDAFINSNEFNTLSYLDQSLLVVQADAMSLYSGVLTQRIQSFPKNK